MMVRLGGLRRRPQKVSKWRKLLWFRKVSTVMKLMSADAEAQRDFKAELEAQRAKRQSMMPADDEEDMYSDDNIHLRQGLRHDPIIRPVLKEWWRTMQRYLMDNDLDQSTVFENSYMNVFMKLYKVMISDYDEKEATESVRDDWENDCGGAGQLKSGDFMDAMFELSDVWTMSTDPNEYAEFLSNLLEQVSSVQDGVRRFLSTEQIRTGAGQPAALKAQLEEEERAEAARKQLNKANSSVAAFLKGMGGEDAGSIGRMGGKDAGSIGRKVNFGGKGPTAMGGLGQLMARNHGAGPENAAKLLQQKQDEEAERKNRLLAAAKKSYQKSRSLAKVQEESSKRKGIKEMPGFRRDPACDHLVRVRAFLPHEPGFAHSSSLRSIELPSTSKLSQQRLFELQEARAQRLQRERQEVAAVLMQQHTRGHLARRTLRSAGKWTDCPPFARPASAAAAAATGPIGPTVGRERISTTSPTGSTSAAAVVHLSMPSPSRPVHVSQRRLNRPEPSARSSPPRRPTNSSRSQRRQAPEGTPAFVRRAFDICDTNQSGDIDGREIRRALQQLGMEADSSEAQAVLEKYDQDKDSRLDLAEFHRVVLELQSIPPAFVRTTFDLFDTNQSGDIDGREIRRALQHLGMEADSSEARTVLEKYDQDKDSRLDINEFHQVVLELLEYQKTIPPFVRSAFDLFDTNQSGDIDGREVRRALQQLGMEANSREARAVLFKYDQDKDSRLDLAEFHRLVLGLLQFQKRQQPPPRPKSPSSPPRRPTSSPSPIRRPKSPSNPLRRPKSPSSPLHRPKSSSSPLRGSSSTHGFTWSPPRKTSPSVPKALEGRHVVVADIVPHNTTRAQWQSRDAMIRAGSRSVLVDEEITQLDRWQKAPSPWSRSPLLPTGWQTAEQQRLAPSGSSPHLLTADLRAASPGQRFRNLDVDSPGSSARVAVQRYGPRHHWVGTIPDKKYRWPPPEIRELEAKEGRPTTAPLPEQNPLR